jgi:hypothetical protein
MQLAFQLNRVQVLREYLQHAAREADALRDACPEETRQAIRTAQAHATALHDELTQEYRAASRPGLPGVVRAVARDARRRRGGTGPQRRRSEPAE